MHDVMTIQSQTEDHLVCGTRLHERLAGLGIAVVASPLVITLGQTLTGGESHALAPFLFLCLVLLFGLYLLLSSRRFTFAAHAGTSMVRITVFGIFLRQQQIEFCQVAIRRRFDWYLFRWLYMLVLVDSSQTRQQAFTMGYVAGCDRAEALAQTIARFTDTTALDFAGQPLDLVGPERESAGNAAGS